MAAQDELLGTIGRLNTETEALAALGALLRARSEGLRLDPKVAERLTAVATALGVQPDQLDDEWETSALAGFAHAFFLQAVDLFQHPERPPAWTIEDPLVLQAQGRASALVAGMIAAAAPGLEGLTEALGDDRAAILDVGSGVGVLALAFCAVWPRAHVVGLEPWAPPMRLARANLSASPLGGRVELRVGRVEELDDHKAFDLAWFPSQFLAPEIVPEGLARCREALRHGGWTVAGLYTAEPGLPEELMRLRVIRSGGRPWTPDEMCTLLTRTGHRDVHTLERTWGAPLALVVGRR